MVAARLAFANTVPSFEHRPLVGASPAGATKAELRNERMRHPIGTDGRLPVAGESSEYDLAIIGGGINGCGIARDAAGRGWRVYLCDQGDLGSATSSASTKLIHGGLRYLEHYQFRLV